MSVYGGLVPLGFGYAFTHSELCYVHYTSFVVRMQSFSLLTERKGCDKIAESNRRKSRNYHPEVIL